LPGERGLRGRVELGKSGGGLSYGYRVTRQRHDGAPATGDREVVYAEAEVIRRIFRDYVAGVSPKALAKQLNAERCPASGWRHRCRRLRCIERRRRPVRCCRRVTRHARGHSRASCWRCTQGRGSELSRRLDLRATERRRSIGQLVFKWSRTSSGVGVTAHRQIRSRSSRAPGLADRKAPSTRFRIQLWTSGWTDCPALRAQRSVVPWLLGPLPEVLKCARALIVKCATLNSPP